MPSPRWRCRSPRAPRSSRDPWPRSPRPSPRAARRRRRRGSWPRSPSRRATPRPTSRPRTSWPRPTPLRAAMCGDARRRRGRARARRRRGGPRPGLPAAAPRRPVPRARRRRRDGLAVLRLDAAPRDRLLPPPRRRRARPTRRGSRSSRVVPYSSLFPGDDEVTLLLAGDGADVPAPDPRVWHQKRYGDDHEPHLDAFARRRIGRARRVREGAMEREFCGVSDESHCWMTRARFASCGK